MFLTVAQSVPLLCFLYKHNVCDCNDITGLGPPIPLQKGVMKEQTKHFYSQKDSGGFFFAARGMEENRPFSLPAFTPVQLQNLEEIT